MKSWSIASVACFLIANSQLLGNVCALEGEDPPGFRSPQCSQNLSKAQNRMLQHFNGIFGTFSIIPESNEDIKNSSIYGPIAALNIKSTGYGYNTNTDDANCHTPNRLLRLGLLAKNSDVRGDVHGSFVTGNGTIDTKSQSEGCIAHSSSLHVVNRIEDMSESLFDFAPTTIRKTSQKLAGFEPDTLIDRRSFSIMSSSSSRSFDGYRILKFPACSDNDCGAAIPRKETSVSLLKAGTNAQPNYDSVPSDEMIVFNIPVFIGKTFTLTTANINRNISPCQIIYNFYPADNKGNYVNDPSATFTLVRDPGVTIAGTILAPQANINDATTGYFGGQLLTLQDYKGKGASIKDFKTVSNGKCTSRSLCLPPERILQTTVQVITQTATATRVRTVDEEGQAVTPSVANRAAVVSKVLTGVTTTVIPSKQ